MISDSYGLITSGGFDDVPGEGVGGPPGILPGGEGPETVWYAGNPMRAVTARLAFLFVVTLVTGGCSLAPAQSKPASGLPAPIRQVLPNGVRVIVQEHRASDVVAVQLWVPSFTVTAPVGVPLPGALAVTVNVKLTAWPTADGFGV